MDRAHRWTDDELDKLEKKIRAVYLKADKVTQEKASEYFDQFANIDAEQLKLLELGEITQNEYKLWRRRKISTGAKFTEFYMMLSKIFTDYNVMAFDLINSYMYNVFAENHNFFGFKLETEVGSDLGIVLINDETIKKLSQDGIKLLPNRKIKVVKDIAWNTKLIQREVLNGIMQGESVYKIAKRLQKVTSMNKNSAIRNARTAVTNAENAGRIDSMRQAESMGIQLHKEWIATLDTRTREAHQLLDNQTAPIDEPFYSILGEIQFPGDPNANPANTYNCRCTLGEKLIDVPTRYDRRENIKIGGSKRILSDISYNEWKAWKG